MSVLPFLAIAVGLGSLSLLVRRAEVVSAIIGIVGLALAALAATAITADSPFVVGGATIAGTAYVRLFLLLGASVGLVLVLVGLATSWSRDLPGATLLGLGAVGLALSVADPLLGILAATGAGLVGVLFAASTPHSEGGLLAAARVTRMLAGAAALALVALAAFRAMAGLESLDRGLLGLAFLAVAAALAVRFGTIPFHTWTSRVAEAAPGVTIPIVMVWGPAAFAIVAIGSTVGSLAPAPSVLPAERAIVAGAGALSLALGTVAALLHDDLEHVVGYSIVADAGVTLLALAALDPAAWGPMRTWLLAFVVTKSALASWAVAVRFAFGTRRLGDLRGWARRSPILGLALVALAAANVGWPGLAVFDARGQVFGLSVGQPAGTLLAVAAVGPLLYYGRLLIVGVGRPTATVAAGSDTAPHWPAARSGPISLPALARSLPGAWRVNRAPFAAAAVAGLAALSVLVGAGGFGVREAAAAPPPSPVVTPSPAPPAPGPTPAPSATPRATLPPRPSATPGAESPAAPRDPSPGATSVSPSGGDVSPAGSGTATDDPSFVPLPPP